MDDEYYSIAVSSRYEFKVDGSRFIANALAATDPQNVDDALKEVRHLLHDATHHCFAYRLGPRADVFRSSDDGEPTGTAGKPILQQIASRGLTNTLVVVTRYFGGTKLGRGGLVRAYRTAAAGALEAGRFERTVIEDHFVLCFGYDDTSGVMRTIEAVDGTITSSKYSDRTELVVAVRRSGAVEFRSRFIENLGGRGSIRRLP